MSSDNQILQWQYTASEFNIENNVNAFCTYSLSEGISREDKTELAKRAGSYWLPENAPTALTDEDICNQPTVFQAFPLPSGRIAVAHTCYVGTVYSNTDRRSGNFFSHALLLPENSPFYSIQFINYGFKTGLTEEEQTRKPDPLPPIDIADLYPFDFTSEILNRLGVHSNLKDEIISLTNAIRDRKKVDKAGMLEKPIFILDSRENLPYWIAAIQLVFPKELTKNISYTSYCSNSLSYDITTQAIEESPSHKTSAVKSQSVVFDFYTGAVPSINRKFNLFSDKISCDEISFPGKEMCAFHSFVENANISVNASDYSLDLCVLMHSFMERNISLNNQTLLSLLRFCSQQNIAVKEQFINKIFQKDTIFTVDILEVLLPNILTMIHGSKKSDLLLSMFGDFTVRQFERPINQLDREYCHNHFKIIDKLCDNNNFSKVVLDKVQTLITQPAECQKYAFLYFSLILCLYKHDAGKFAEFLNLLRLDAQEVNLFFEATLEIAISRSFLPKTHEQIVTFHARQHGGELTKDFAINYIRKLSHPDYGFGQLKNRKPACPISVAFIKYLLDLPENPKNIAISNSWISYGACTLFAIGGNKKEIERARAAVYETLKSQLLAEYKTMSSDEHFNLKTNLLQHKSFWQKRWHNIASTCEWCKDFIVEQWKGILIVMLIALFFLLSFMFWDKIMDALKSAGQLALPRQENLESAPVSPENAPSQSDPPIPATSQ